MNLNAKQLTLIIVLVALFAFGAMGIGVFSISQAPDAVPMTGDNVAAALEAQSSLSQARALERAHELELSQTRVDAIRVQGQADVDRTRAEADLSKANVLLSAENARGFLISTLAIGGSIAAIAGIIMLLAPHWMRVSAEAEERKVRSQIILENFALLPPEAQVGLIMPPGRQIPQLSQVTGRPLAGHLLASPIREERPPASKPIPPAQHQSMDYNTQTWSDFYNKLDRQYGAE